MKKTVMKKWVKALRSGKFKQGKKQLKQTNPQGKVNHCCLGVLCELYNDEITKNKKKPLDFSDELVLPRQVMNWSGLCTEEGEFEISLTTKSSPVSLSEMNDDGKRFTTIANFIEKNWESL